MHLLRRILAGACLSLVFGAAQSQVVMREVIATGNGGDPSRATIDAIENAISQVGGMRISTATSLSMSEVSRGGETQIDESFRQNIEKITRGVIRSYTVLESGISPGTGRAFVRIKAQIPTYRASEQLKRLKLAVVPMALAGSARGRADASEFAENVSAALEAQLTQTRKFAMLDRRYSERSQRELAPIQAGRAPIEEAVKLGARAGADYLVMAVLKEFSPQQQQQQRVTGRVTTRSMAPVSIDVRVIDVATGQIKFAQTYQNPGRLHASVSLSQYAADVGTDIGQVIGTAIYPIAVVGGNDTEITFNQGGDTVQVGRIYRLVSLGQPLVDPYTRESLGPQEQEVARAEVTSVTDRTATARIVSGRLALPIKPGAVLARVLPEELSNASSMRTGLPGAAPPQPGAQGAGRKSDNDDW